MNKRDMKNKLSDNELRCRRPLSGLLRGVAALAGAAALLAGCSEESQTNALPGGDAARVTLSFSAEGPLHAVDKDAAKVRGAAVPAPADTPAGTAARGLLNPSMVDEWAVADMWVLQYDMSAGPEGRLAARRYVPYAEQDGSNVRVSADLEPMEKARIVVLANAPGPIDESALPAGSTLSDLAALTFDINAGSGSALPEEYSATLPMRGDSDGELKLEMGQVATVRVPLYRLVSKVNFTLENRCAEGWPRLTLTSVALRNVPAVGSYVRVIESTHASVRYPAAASANFKDYDAVGEGFGSQCELLWYMAPNSRGVGSGTTPADKTQANAPQDQGGCCTYVYVQGMMQQSEDGQLIPMNYRVYLGGNNTNDYNVWANEAYRIRMTVSSLPDAPDVEVGHDGFTVELDGPDGSHDNPVDGWEILIDGATVSPDPSAGITYKGGSYTFTVFGKFSGTVPVRISSGGTTLASGNASAGVGVKLTLPENGSAQSRTVNFEYNPSGTWTAIKSGTQQGKPSDQVDGGNVWVGKQHYTAINWHDATSTCAGKGMRLPNRSELTYILGNRAALGLSDLTDPCAYWTRDVNGTSYAYGVEASDSRTTFYHWKTDRRCSLCVKDK